MPTFSRDDQRSLYRLPQLPRNTLSNPFSCACLIVLNSRCTRRGYELYLITIQRDVKIVWIFNNSCVSPFPFYRLILLLCA